MMFQAFLLGLRQGTGLLWWSWVHLLTVDVRAFPKRLLLFTGGVPLFFGLQGIHWIGFLLDELLFPGYRQIRIDRPVFIIGIPRSGTTFLQRTMAQDSRLTTTQTWECVLAPSITERLVYRSIGRLLAPLGRLLPKRVGGFLNQMEAIHELGLQEPEEDFLLLLPIFSCFILMAVFPRAENIWRLAFFDRDVPARDRQIILAYYRRCIQKHLYVHGPDRRYLSKNPSFSSLLRSLHNTFPDGKLIVTIREPAATVPSQLSSLRPALALVGSGSFPAGFQDRVIGMLHFYYRTFAEVVPSLPAGPPVLNNRAIKKRLKQCLTRIYNYIDLPQPADFDRKASEMAADSAGYKSRHRYGLEEFGLNEAVIERLFADVWPLNLDQLEEEKRAAARV